MVLSDREKAKRQEDIEEVKRDYMSWRIGNHSAVMKLTYILGDADEAWSVLMDWEEE